MGKLLNKLEQLDEKFNQYHGISNQISAYKKDILSTKYSYTKESEEIMIKNDIDELNKLINELEDLWVELQ